MTENKNNYRPIVIHMSHLEAKLLVVFGLELDCVIYYVVVRRVHRSLRNMLRYQIEVEPLFNSINQT